MYFTQVGHRVLPPLYFEIVLVLVHRPLLLLFGLYRRKLMAFMMFSDCKASGQMGRFIGLFLLMNVMLQPLNVFPEML